MNGPVGVIAGAGDLPLLMEQALAAAGRAAVFITFDPRQRDRLAARGAHASLFGLGEVNKIIAALKASGAREVAFAGKVDKRVLWRKPWLDTRARSILRNAGKLNDDAIMLAIVAELEKEGLPVASQAELLRAVMPGPGPLTLRAPDAREQADIAFGMEMARGIAALDIGQTVVIHQLAVMAAEAIEGTDEAIARGAKIAGADAVVCKVSKPKQDPRFDVPTVGPGTIETMARVKASCLAFEAGATLVVSQNETVALANRHHIAVVAA